MPCVTSTHCSKLRRSHSLRRGVCIFSKGTPSACKVSARCEPTNPEPPVIRILLFFRSIIFFANTRGTFSSYARRNTELLSTYHFKFWQWNDKFTAGRKEFMLTFNKLLQKMPW